MASSFRDTPPARVALSEAVDTGTAGGGPGGSGTGPGGADQRRIFLGAVKWALAMHWGERALGVLFTFVLAALLGPHDFGVVAIAMIYISLAHVFLEQGFSTALIQRDDLEPDHLHSAFWMNLLWCLVLTGLTVAVSGWWADVNGAPVLREVLSVLSLMLVIEALIIVQEAFLQREGEFKKLAILSNVAALVGGALGVALALAGAGVWALVSQQLAASATTLVLIWTLSAWKPRLRFSRRHARDLLGFSSRVFVANLGGFVNRRSDALLVGVVFGPVAVGIYRLADRFVDFVLELTTRPVGVVALPLFSRLQHDREHLRSAVETCLRVTLIAVVPALLLIAACSEFLLDLIGPEWKAGADALKLLAVAGIAKAVISFTGPLLFALGRPWFRAVMVWLLGAASAAAVVVVALLLQTASVERQLFGVSASRAALFLLVFVPINLLVVRNLTGFGLRDFVALAAPPTAAGVAATAVVVALREATSIERLAPAAGLAVAALLAAATAAATLLALDTDCRDYAKGLRRKLSRGR